VIKRDTHTLYFACRDPRTPWYVKLPAAGIVAYALSPIDLIPDFIPVLGYLDDVIPIDLRVPEFELVHSHGLYDVEVDTSMTSIADAVGLIRARLSAPAAAFETLRARQR
jgi:uncharacterized membrane protein YkvA (DUF1232 family)